MSGLDLALRHARASAEAFAAAIEHGAIADFNHARFLACAKVLDRDLTVAHDLALIRDAELALELGLNRTRARAQALARELSRNRAPIPGFAHHLARAIAFEEARAVSRGLSYSLSRSPVSGRNQVPRWNKPANITTAADRAGSLIRDLSAASGRIRALDFARPRVRASDLARATAAIAPCQAKKTTPSAVRLLNAATQVLPVINRERYAEEYAGELKRLAEAGTGRWGQVGYALRQLRKAPQMRLALRSPRRRSALP
jgi:hypothetical protein